jgi:hypothetical protein
MRKHSIVLCGLLLGLGGCVGDRLNVENLNSPDVARAYATPDGIEGVIAGLGPQLNNPQRASESVNTQAKIFAGESFATVANFGMALRSQIPRGAIDNELGNVVAAGNVNNYNSFQRLARTAVNGIQAVDRLVENTNGIGLNSPARNARAKAFAFLILGQALGYTSFAYDSAAILTPAVPSDEVPGLSAAKDVNAAAIAMLDSAIAIAQSPAATTGGSGFPLPPTWISGTSYTRDEFVALARSYRARIRAGVARTPAERAAVNWASVIADAEAGIKTDHQVTIGGSTGWSAQFDVGQIYVVGGWHSMPMYYFGMADTSGAYVTWLNTPRDDRRQFTVVTADKRWPRGVTRAEQSTPQTNNLLPNGQYFRNRPAGSDVLGASWGESQYDHRRYGATQAAAGGGPYTDMSATEMSMLAAEGHIRAGNFGAAMTLINASRTRSGLPAISGITSATQPIGTGAGCIPRVPQGPSFTTVACGNILEAMKYEKRMETAFTGYMIWFTDSRGWGDLVATTPLEWPVPYQEMNARIQAFYNGTTQAPIGTYGFQ